jgi:hypothetical protein
MYACSSDEEKEAIAIASKQFLRFILMQKSAESPPKEQGRKIIDRRCWWFVSCARGKCEDFL